MDIAAEDLEVLEDGVAQKVDTFQEAVDPVSIILDLDASGSMKKSAEAVQAAARDFVAAVRPEDQLALITFADRVNFGHTLSINRQLTLDAIEQYVANGGTALYDALWTSLIHLKEVPGRHAIVVLTDGKDENNPGTAPGSTRTLEEVTEAGTVGRRDGLPDRPWSEGRARGAGPPGLGIGRHGVLRVAVGGAHRAVPSDRRQSPASFRARLQLHEYRPRWRLAFGRNPSARRPEAVCLEPGRIFRSASINPRVHFDRPGAMRLS